MSHKLLLVFFLLLNLTLSAQNETQEIKKTFNQFKEAIMNSNGEKAFSLVNQTTIDYYSRILQLSQSADSVEILELDIMDKYYVLLTRARLEPEELMNMSTREYFTYGINEGLVAQSGADQMTLDDINITGNSASAQILVNGQQTPIRYKFHKVDGGWKIDMISVFGPTRDKLHQSLKQSGRTPKEYLTILMTAAGETYSNALWHPANQK